MGALAQIVLLIAFMKIATLLTSLLLGSALLSLHPVGYAQPTPAAENLEGRARNNQYAVKIVCGKAPGNEAAGVLAAGQYFTAVNVHNPGRTSALY